MDLVEDLPLAVGGVDRFLPALFELADLDDHFGAFVEQIDDPLVDFVDLATPVSQIGPMFVLGHGGQHCNGQPWVWVTRAW